MSHIEFSNQVLRALVKEHGEQRRPVRTLIVQAACNASSAANRDRVLVALAGMKRHGLVTQHDDAWAPTPEGKVRVAHLPTGSHQAPKRLGSADSRRHATLSPMVGGAPRPVTRPDSKKVAPAGSGAPQSSSHQKLPELNAQRPEKSVQPIQSENNLPGQLPNQNVAIPSDLLNRCATMQMALLEDARRRYDQGDLDAASELTWLLETGTQLLKAGGAQ